MDKKRFGAFLKKYWKPTVAFLVIFALLLGAYIIIENYEPAKKTADPVSTPAIPMLSLDPAMFIL